MKAYFDNSTGRWSCVIEGVRLDGCIHDWEACIETAYTRKYDSDEKIEVTLSAAEVAKYFRAVTKKFEAEIANFNKRKIQELEK